ncbi:hypothetical protein QVZ41_13770 [Wenyingzhuangia sp. chi5]|uniref:Addiction module component n=1 Tax=Wenyingzhuangia gilva TaxID=3057677 RepID=A0ABT8VVA4_9FLAO|nr:hypothetical protein [Wenyingzhuangia sp. chi5]MDO3695914.1 hypothetical protein [Wenyingzhuangia sp. chi5]
MDLQSRKIEFIQEFLKIQSEEAISKLEKILRKEKASNISKEIKPMSIEQFNERINKSMEDSENGRVIETSQLKAKIEKWA